MIIIAQYKGKSLISKLIRWQTRSDYSHSAVILKDDSVIEAWQKGGVSHVNDLSTNHTAGTIVDIYTVQCTDAQEEIFEEFLLEQVGKPYDFNMVFRFLTHQPAIRNNKWFCSELVVMALKHARLSPFAFVAEAAKVSPGLLPWSLKLRYDSTVETE